MCNCSEINLMYIRCLANTWTMAGVLLGDYSPLQIQSGFIVCPKEYVSNVGYIVRLDFASEFSNS